MNFLTKKFEGIKKYWVIGACVVSIFVVPILSGCETQRSTTRTTTTTQPVEEEDQDTAKAVEQQEKTTVTTEKTTTTQPKSDGGILGGVFHLVGEVLAFPFRMIAGAFDAIF